MVNIDQMELPSVPWITGWNRGSDVVLVHHPKGREKQYVVVQPAWYFFILAEEATTHREALVGLQKQGLIQRFEKYYMDHRYIRVYVDNQNLSRTKLANGELDAKNAVVQELKKLKVQTFEADLSSLDRLRVDRGLEIATDYQVVYLDIETKDTDANGNRAPMVIGTQPILSVAFAFSDGTHFFVGGVHEREILTAILTVLEQADICITFNGEHFDLPTIFARCELYNMDWFRPTRAVCFIDQYLWFRKFHATNSEITDYKLATLAEYFFPDDLNKRKLEHSGTVYSMFQKDFELFKAYNIRDSMLMLWLDQDQHMTESVVYDCRTCHTFLTQYVGYHGSRKKFYGSFLIDNYILRRARLEGQPMITASPKFKDHKYCGARVLEPVPGRYDNVCIFDFRSLYPSLIRTWNIGIETLVNDFSKQIELENRGQPMTISAIESAQEMGLYTADELERRAHMAKDWVTNAHGIMEEKEFERTVRFSLETESVLAQAVRIFMGERARVKLLMKEVEDQGRKQVELVLYDRLDREQGAWKIRANSVYGITGSIYSRYYHLDVAESITIAGRAVLVLTQQWFRENGYQLIYGDTDSIFVAIGHAATTAELQAIADRFGAWINAEIKRRYQVPTSYVELGVDKFYTRMFLGRKKYYGGLERQKDGTTKFKGKGLDYIKRNVPEFAKAVHKMLCTHVVTHDRDADFYGKKLWEWARKILRDSIDPKDIEGYAIWVKAQDVSAYQEGKVPVHARILEDLKKRGFQTLPGQAIPLIRVIPAAGETKVDGVYAPEFLASGREMDRKHYWQKEVFSRVRTILEAAFPTYDWDQFDLDIREKRKTLLAKWKSKTQDQKGTHRTFRKTLHEIAQAPWLKSDDRELLSKQMSPDHQVLLEAKLLEWIRKRIPAYLEQTMLDAPCGPCGFPGPVFRGTVVGTKHRKLQSLCPNCGHEKDLMKVVPAEPPAADLVDEVVDLPEDDERM
jgi:DNA polymerase elongation subunit (family B)